MTPEPPSVPQLRAAPELAALHLLVEAIATAEQALLAEHPDLGDIECAARDGPPQATTALAESIIRLGSVVAEAADAYRAAVLMDSLSLHSPNDNRDF